MPLTTSDWVTIASTVASILCSTLVSVGIAIWQFKKMAAAKVADGNAKEQVLGSASRKWLLSQVWPLLFYSALAIYLIISALSSTGEVTRTFVIQFVCGAFLLSFSILYSVALVIAAAFRPAYFALSNFASRASQKREA